MRHNKKFNHLGRKKAHRDALLANMTVSLIKHKRIFTTLAKAKALRMYCEPLINRAKEDTMTNRRVVFSYLQNKEAVTEHFHLNYCFIVSHHIGRDFLFSFYFRRGSVKFIKILH